MKTLQNMKHWLTTTLVLVGISLTVYAVAPAVFIRNITEQNVTSTSAEVVVSHVGVSSLRFEIYTEDGSYHKDEYILTGTTDLNATCVNTLYISDLSPNEKYYVLVTAGGFPDLYEGEETNNLTTFTVFTTQID
jgi:hypothetical protein